MRLLYILTVLAAWLLTMVIVAHFVFFGTTVRWGGFTIMVFSLDAGLLFDAGCHYARKGTP